MVLIWRESGKYIDAAVTNFNELDDLGLIPNFRIPIPQNLPEILIDIATGGEPNDFFYAGTLFIVSDSLKAILTSFPIEIEFREVSVTQQEKRYNKKRFYYGNILEEV